MPIRNLEDSLVALPVQERLCVFARIGRDDMAIADELVFVNEQALDSHGAACVSLVRADADLGAEAIAEPICKSSRRIPVDPGGVHFIQESARVLCLLGNDRIRMCGTVFMNVVNRLVETVDDPH